MCQKSAFALMLIVLLSIIVVTPIAFTNMANANFCFPPSNPDITINSPVNTTYTTNNVFLNVTIATYRTGWSGAPEGESYRNFEYSVDGNEFQPIEISNATVGRNPGNHVQFDGLISLYQLSEGNHTLTVKAVLNYYEYTPNEDLLHTESISNAFIVIDTVLDTPVPDAINNLGLSIPQLVMVALALTAVAVVSFLVYLRLKS